MALVGDILMRCRRQAPDLPQTMQAPNIVSLTATTGGSFPNGTYYVVMTALNQWGETVASNEQNVVLSGSNNAFTAVWAQAGGGATASRVYIGSASGGQNQYVAVSNSGSALVTLAGVIPGAPPTRNTGFLPDTDGSFVDAYNIYDWLNEALGLAARITGGIQDHTGIATNVAQPIYQINGQWINFTHVFFDGWPIGLGGKHDTFQRTRVQGITGIVTPFKQNNTQWVECWPIPNRTAVATTTTGSIALTDTTIPVASLPVLDHGLVQIDNEIVYYGQFSGLNLIGCVRGVGGTAPATHSNGATVTELNLQLRGYRMPETYTVGQSAATLTVPPGWDTILPLYLLSKFRETEQDAQGAMTKRQQFEQEMKGWVAANKTIAGPVQMGTRSGILDVIPGGGGGGLIRL